MSVETGYALTATLIGVGVLVLMIAFILPRLVSEDTEKKTNDASDEVNVNDESVVMVGEETATESPVEQHPAPEPPHIERDEQAKASRDRINPRTRTKRGNAA